MQGPYDGKRIKFVWSAPAWKEVLDDGYGLERVILSSI